MGFLIFISFLFRLWLPAVTKDLEKGSSKERVVCAAFHSPLAQESGAATAGDEALS